MSIIVTGTTGQLGGLVIRELLKKYPTKQLVACVRNPDKAAGLKAQGIEIRQADYNHYDSLRKALAGADKLLFISGSDLDDTRRAIQHATVASGELVSNCRQGKVNAVSRADLARAAAAALSGEGHLNKTYNLVAPRPWDHAELARVLTEVSGKQVAFRPLSADEGKSRLTAAGLPEPVAGFLSFIYERVAAGETARTSPDLEALIGKAVTLKEEVAAVLRS